MVKAKLEKKKRKEIEKKRNRISHDRKYSRGSDVESDELANESIRSHAK